MVFSDPVFIFLFLPICILAYWIFPTSKRNLLLVISGIVFYSLAGVHFTALLLLTIVINHRCASMITSQMRSARATQFLLLGAVAVNLLNLLYWKYTSWIASSFGVHIHLVLPIAISFYTFQQISFLIDAHKGRTSSVPPLLDYTAYIVMFPHLIAGPIVRYAEISAELSTEPSTRTDDFIYGFSRFIWGLSKKILIADQVAVIADKSFGVPSELMTTQIAWLGAIAYSLQIYFDFSGYSDMAIGLARIFGFKFPENFNRPYSSTSITDFWRRWHVSLSRWFRDYVYIPLGGNRRGVPRTYLNLFVVFFLTGLWHGANWTFIVWGMCHGLALVFERVLGVDSLNLSRKRAIPYRVLTLLFVTTTWVYFRAPNVHKANDIVTSMWSLRSGAIPFQISEALTVQRVLWFAVGLLVVFLPSTLPIGVLIQTRTRYSMQLRVAMLLSAGILTLIYSLSSTFSPFLYFQF